MPHTTIDLNDKTLDVEFDYSNHPYGIESIELSGKCYRGVLARFKRIFGVDLEKKIEEEIVNELIND